MTLLKFVGSRQKPFSTEAAGHVIYVQPGEPVAVPDEAAAVLLERDPDLWQVVDKPKAKSRQEG